jgi:beta-carotene hydroxylase
MRENRRKLQVNRQFRRWTMLDQIRPHGLGQLLLAAIFDWIVHYPYTGTNRFNMTNAFYSNSNLIDRLFSVLTFGQNLHLIHHLYPWVPFYSYRTLFVEIRAYLDDKKSALVKF